LFVLSSSLLCLKEKVIGNREELNCTSLDSFEWTFFDCLMNPFLSDSFPIFIVPRKTESRKRAIRTWWLCQIWEFVLVQHYFERKMNPCLQFLTSSLPILLLKS
jgi:hypothetical protein